MTGRLVDKTVNVSAYRKEQIKKRKKMERRREKSEFQICEYFQRIVKHDIKATDIPQYDSILEKQDCYENMAKFFFIWKSN